MTRNGMALTLTITVPALLAGGGMTLASGVPADASVTAQASPVPGCGIAAWARRRLGLPPHPRLR
jgi:hypothetical protein